MNKKITNLFLAGALVVGLAGVAVSCTDYDDDINKLQEQVNAANSKVNDLTTQVANLQAAINAGAVITNVETVAAGKDSELPNGGVIVTLSDGKKFKVANGANGTNGENGEDGTIVTIGADGYWYMDGKKTQYKAAGEDGADGKDADQIWYAPDTDKESASYGKWVKYTLKAGETTPTAEPTEESWLVAGGAANVVLTDDYLVISCLDENGEEVVVKVTLSVKLASLVFVPQVYVDGVEAMDAPTFTYTAIDSADFNTKDEAWEIVDGADTTITPALVAKYHINPANAVLSADAEYSFVLNQEGNTPFVVTRDTRAQAEGLALVAEYAGEEIDTTGAGRLLKINVNVAGTPATDEFISVVALKYADADTTVVSDYATIYAHDIADFIIADPDAQATKKGLDDEHYRTILGEADAEATLWPNVAPWNEAREDYDTVVVYNGKLDLAGIVAAHTADDDTEYTAEQLEALGLTWEFSLVEGYKVEDDENLPAEDFFAKVDGTEFIPQNGLAAIGRTPIVRVLLKEGEKVVKVAYIKVKITGVPVELKPVNVEGENVFTFNCEESIDSVTFADLMKNVVEPTGYSYTMFTDTVYTEFKAMPAKEVADSVTAWFEAEDSCIFMEVAPEYIFNHSGEEVELAAKFYNADDTTLAIEVLLTAKLDEVAKTFDLSSAKGDYINEYWWGPDRENAEGYDLTKFNVNVPDVGETDSTKCQFVNDLNAAFVTKDGKTVIDENLSGLEFFFCEDVKNIKKIAEQEVKFEVVDDTVLVATATFKNIETGKDTTVKKDTIAVINNSGEAVPYNYVTYNKESDLAKLLLNTDAMYTFIGAKANLCENENMPVAITFDGEDHFRGDFIRPVYIVNETPEFLVDAVDYLEKYSYIDIAGLVSPYDWRARNFADYENYWDYYGGFEISVNVDDITCDLNGKMQAVPATITLEQMEMEGHEYGVLAYKNNGNNVSTFNLYIPVTVKYGWGYIQTDAIKVKVYGTLEEIPTTK